MAERYDVVIVGSGPVGSAYAREVVRVRPASSVLIVEAGPVISDPPGINVRNITAPEQRHRAQRLAQGRVPQPPAPTAGPPVGIYARPGTHLVALPESQEQDPHDGMPAAAMSTNVGGMGAHWTCACPDPGGRERIPFIDEQTWQAAAARSRELLAVTVDGFAATPAAEAVRGAFGRAFAGMLGDRAVGPMPLACIPREHGLPIWSGAATVLDGLLTAPETGVALAAETICREILVAGGRGRGVRLEDLASGRSRTVEADVIVVAADAFRTPQLLFASGIRPPALGRHLNDQPQTIAAAYLPGEVMARGGSTATRADVARAEGAAGQDPEDGRDHLTGVSWVPYADPDHPFHGQVMQLDTSPVDMGVDDESGAVVGLGWFCAKEIRAEDRVAFSDTERDAYDMPKMTIHYGLGDRDRERLAQAQECQLRAANAIGGLAPRGAPMVLAAGSSLHYQGSVRMGDDGGEASVCDPQSRLWSHSNVILGGNGVIPTATACNPTLTSVALAVIGARAAVAEL